MTYKVTMAELQKKSSHIMNLVYYGRRTVLVTKHGSVVARIVPNELERGPVDLDEVPDALEAEIVLSVVDD